MGQQNPLAATVAKNPSNVQVQLKVDAAGNLQVVLEEGTTSTIATKAVGQPYATVAASQTKQLLGATGAIGDVIAGMTIVPETATPGIVEIYDSSGGSAIILYEGGATQPLVPIALANLNMASAAGGWYVTTGANVHVIVTGKFT